MDFHFATTGFSRNLASGIDAQAELDPTLIKMLKFYL